MTRKSKREVTCESWHRSTEGCSCTDSNSPAGTGTLVAPPRGSSGSRARCPRNMLQTEVHSCHTWESQLARCSVFHVWSNSVELPGSLLDWESTAPKKFASESKLGLDTNCVGEQMSRKRRVSIRTWFLKFVGVVGGAALMSRRLLRCGRTRRVGWGGLGGNLNAQQQQQQQLQSHAAALQSGHRFFQVLLSKRKSRKILAESQGIKLQNSFLTTPTNCVCQIFACRFGIAPQGCLQNIWLMKTFKLPRKFSSFNRSIVVLLTRSIFRLSLSPDQEDWKKIRVCAPHWTQIVGHKNVSVTIACWNDRSRTRGHTRLDFPRFVFVFEVLKRYRQNVGVSHLKNRQYKSQTNTEKQPTRSHAWNTFPQKTNSKHVAPDKMPEERNFDGPRDPGGDNGQHEATPTASSTNIFPSGEQQTCFPENTPNGMFAPLNGPGLPPVILLPVVFLGFNWHLEKQASSNQAHPKHTNTNSGEGGAGESGTGSGERGLWPPAWHWACSSNSDFMWCENMRASSRTPWHCSHWCWSRIWGWNRNRNWNWNRNRNRRLARTHAVHCGPDGFGRRLESFLHQLRVELRIRKDGFLKTHINERGDL